MEESDRDIFQQLISDTQFVRWAKGKPVSDAAQWDSWKLVHPKDAAKFDEATRLVRNLSFSVPEISDRELYDGWTTLFTRKIGQPGKTKLRRLRETVIKIAAFLFIPLVAYAGWMYFNKDYVESEYAKLAQTLTAHNISVVAPIGTRTVVNLPDGSKAWLNAQTQLVYPAFFSEEERRVRINGEAFFEIQEGEIPFIVENLGPEIKVYGTSFNVNSYEDEELVTVALVDGEISLQINGEEQFLDPGEIFYFNKVRQLSSIKSEDTTRFICWREGKFIFRDTPLSSILRQLQRQYNVEINLTHTELGDYRYNATFQNENLDQILELIKLSAPVKYEYRKANLKNDGTHLKGKVTIYEDQERIIR